jgi:hypothetical protein
MNGQSGRKFVKCGVTALATFVVFVFNFNADCQCRFALRRHCLPANRGAFADPMPEWS